MLGGKRGKFWARWHQLGDRHVSIQNTPYIYTQPTRLAAMSNIRLRRSALLSGPQPDTGDAPRSDGRSASCSPGGNQAARIPERGLRGKVGWAAWSFAEIGCVGCFVRSYQMAQDNCSAPTPTSPNKVIRSDGCGLASALVRLGRSRRTNRITTFCARCLHPAGTASAMVGIVLGASHVHGTFRNPICISRPKGV